MAIFENAVFGRVTLTDSGAVTQATSISTGVTLNRTFGQITTVSSVTTAAGAEDSFVVTCGKIKGPRDVVLPCVATYGGAGLPVVHITAVAAGQFTITIANLHASAALNAALVINYVVFNAGG
jgi:hypothetical protein